MSQAPKPPPPAKAPKPPAKPPTPPPPDKAPSKVLSAVLSKVDLVAATRSAILEPLQLVAREEEEYDPHKHRNVAKPISYSETMSHMLKACFGVGMLAMPSAFARLGLVFGTVGVFALGFFATYCIQILIKGQYRVCKKAKVGYLSFPQSMKLAIKDGPPFMRWSAVPFAWATDAFIILWQIGVCSIFLVFVGANIQQVILIWGLNVQLRILICCLYPLLVVVGMVKDLKLLAPLSSISLLCNVIGIFLVFYYLVYDDVELDASKYSIKSLADIPIFIGTVLYAMEAVGVILALEYKMENPKEFTGWCGLFSLGMCVIVCTYSALGIFGYLKYGAATEASITFNLPSHEKKAQVANLAFAATILLSYPLQNYVAWQVIWNLIESKVSNNKKAVDMSLRVVLTTFPFVPAVAAPTLGPFIGLVGSLCLSTAAIFFPAVIDICVYYPDQYGTCFYKLFIDIFILLFGAFCCFSGVYTSILEMIDTL